MTEGMSGGTYPNRRWVKGNIAEAQALEQQARMGWDESRRRERELRADLTQVRAALRQIRDYVLLEYQEGDKPFQFAILATTVLDETQDPWQGVYPDMCVDPETCRGYSHCPRPYSCSE